MIFVLLAGKPPVTSTVTLLDLFYVSFQHLRVDWNAQFKFRQPRQTDNNNLAIP